MEKDYLEVVKSSDLKSSKDRALFRFFEILPGFLSLATLFLAFILSWQKPVIAAIFIILFDIYWLLKISYLSFHQIASYQKMRENLKINWLEKARNLPNFKNIYHLIILPMYKEEIEIVRSSLEALLLADYPKDKMLVVLATEEKAGILAQDTAKEIEKEFGQKFSRFLITVHPQNILGEITGKGSNVAWAAKQAKEKIIDKIPIPYENIIVSNFDIDARPYPQYFACLTWHYLTAEKPLRLSYQPIPVYNNNIWDAPAFSRVIATSGTFWQMMQQERPEQLVTYSSHALPFEIFEKINYPSNIVSDDSHIFWKSYFFYDGDYKVVPLHYPLSMDAVMAKSLFRTAINQYKQQRRWAWGCVEIPYLLYGFFKDKKIPLKEKFRHSFVMLEGFWSWGVASLLIFFLGWLPSVLGGEEFSATLFSYNLPSLTGNLMALSMFGMFISGALSMRILPRRPKKYGKLKNLSMVFQWFLLPLTLILFGVFPALDAQIRLMINKPLGFWVTEKVRK